MSDSRPPFPARPASDQAATRRQPGWSQDIKSYYDALASEPVPRDFEKLMARLAKAIRN